MSFGLHYSAVCLRKFFQRLATPWATRRIRINKNVSDGSARETHHAGSVLDKVLVRAPQVHLFQRRNRARLARRAGWKAFAAALLSTFIVRVAG